MPHGDVLDAPEIDLHAPRRDEQWKREFAAFQALLPELLKTDRDRFAAVCKGVVVALGETFKETALQAYARCGYVPLHVGKVTKSLTAPIRLPFARNVVRETQA